MADTAPRHNVRAPLDSRDTTHDAALLAPPATKGTAGRCSHACAWETASGRGKRRGQYSRRTWGSTNSRAPANPPQLPPGPQSRVCCWEDSPRTSAHDSQKGRGRRVRRRRLSSAPCLSRNRPGSPLILPPRSQARTPCTPPTRRGSAPSAYIARCTKLQCGCRAVRCKVGGREGQGAGGARGKKNCCRGDGRPSVLTAALTPPRARPRRCW
jgi:hypothetical protein